MCVPLYGVMLNLDIGTCCYGLVQLLYNVITV